MTTIRVDSDTHAQLIELSRAAGVPLIETVRDATEALRRQRLANRVVAELDELRADGDSWNDYLLEAEVTSVRDGIGR